MPQVRCQSATTMSQTNEEGQEQMMKKEEKISTEVNVEVKEMLKVESKYCTRIRHTISMKSPVPASSPIIREDVPIPDARVFLLHNLLTPSECSHYIDQTEEICYRDLKSEFEESYRSNERLLVLSQTLADYLWRRMQPHLHRNDVIRVRPMCFGNGGSWLPQRLNECFKFGKYQQKQHFGSHIDGPWVPRADESSIYTVLIYLNDNFEGGETVFTPPSGRAKLDQQIAATRESIDVELKCLSLSPSARAPAPELNSHYPTDPWTGQVTIQPRQGTALIFTHDTLHAGLPVLAGKKYVLRTEIMFTRRDSNEIPVSIRESYQSDPNYQQTVTFYMDSYAKSLKGDVPGFTNSYLAALKLQHEAQFSVSKDTKAIHELNLPLSLYVHLFTFLDLKDLVSALQCSKSFKDISKDGSLWKQLYRIRFPAQAQMESHLQQQQRLINQSSISSSNPSLPTDGQDTGASSLGTKEEKKPALPEGVIGKDIPEYMERLAAITSTLRDPNQSSTDGDGSSKPAKKKRQTISLKSRLEFGPIDPAIQDWYTIFKQRVLLQNNFEPVIFDFGSFSTKCSLMNPSDMPILELLNLVAIKPGMFDIHCRRGAQERYLVGMAVRSDSKHDYYRCSKNIIVKGQPADQMSLLPELVASCLLKLSIWSYQHPMIIAEPPFGFEDDQRRALVKTLFPIFDLPGLCFVNSAILSLMSQGLDSGIVAHVGHDTAWVAGIYRRRQISFYNFTPMLLSPNYLFNQTFRQRNQGRNEYEEDAAVDGGYIPLEEIRDGTLTPQKQVTPEEIAEWTANTYHEMLAKINDDHQANFHQVVLCGGGTIEAEFRTRYQLAINAANGTRRPADITKIREAMLKEANMPVSVPVHSGYIHDLSVILPVNPTHTEVEGGKIFGGLSFFQQHCIHRFELKHLEDSDDDEEQEEEEDEDDPNYEVDAMHLYPQVWDTDEWLRTQFMYFTIKNHFHEEAGTFIANTSCSDDEMERLIQEEGVKDAQHLEFDSKQPWPVIAVGRSLVWRRRRLKAHPRGPKPPKQKAHKQHPSKRTMDSDQDNENDEESSSSESSSSDEDSNDEDDVDEEKSEMERPQAEDVQPHNPSVPLKLHPKYPMRRARRSAFPILPEKVVEWYEHQRRIRSLTEPAPQVVVDTQLPSTDTTTEAKDDVPDELAQYVIAAPDVADDLVDPHFPADISSEPSAHERQQGLPNFWEVTRLMDEIRPKFSGTIGHRPKKKKSFDQSPSSSTLNQEEEELEALSDEEEFVEQPPRLVQFKLDHFRGLQRARELANRFPTNHAPAPSSFVTHYKFNCLVRLCSRAPDGFGGEMDVAYFFHNHGAILRFVTYEFNGRIVAGSDMHSGFPSVFTSLGLLVGCRGRQPWDPKPNLPHYPHITDNACVYLTTRPISAQTNEVEEEHTFLIQISWNNTNVEVGDLVQAAHECLALAETKNQPPITSQTRELFNTMFTTPKFH